MTQSLGKYRLLRKIGAGGMAEIWKARAEGPAGFSKVVAIKRVLPDLAADDEFIEMFIDEAKLVATLSHPNIVQVIDFGEVPGAEAGREYFIAMEYVPGQNLASVLRALWKQKLSLTPELAGYIALESARGLASAHAAKDSRGRPMQIVHRDVSPHNILVSWSGEVKVTDFGIAKVATALARTATGVFKGKLSYMSPEQARLEILDGRSDVFSLGIVFFEASCGRRLFADKSSEQIRARVLEFEPPVLGDLANLPPAVASILRRMLAPDRNRRPEAKALEAELAEALGAAAITQARDRLAEVMRALFEKEITDDIDPDAEEAFVRGGTQISAREDEREDPPHTRLSPFDLSKPSGLVRALDEFGAPVSTPAGPQAQQPTQLRPGNEKPPSPPADAFSDRAAPGTTVGSVTEAAPAPLRRSPAVFVAAAAGVCLAIAAGVWGADRFAESTTPAASPIASASPSAPPSSPFTSPVSSFSTPLPPAMRARLDSLEHLRNEGLITPNEFEARKKSILAGH